jgi:hypothetical protein
MTAADMQSLTRGCAHDRAEVLSRPHPECEVDQQEPTGWTIRPDTNSDTNEEAPTAEQVAGVVAGIPVIGKACEALIQAGWRASIAGNRITVNDEVLAQFIGARVGHGGGIDATWVIYAIAGAPPVWIVGAERQP